MRGECSWLSAWLFGFWLTPWLFGLLAHAFAVWASGSRLLLFGLLAHAFAVRASGSRIGCWGFWLTPWLLWLLTHALAVRASRSRLGCSGFWLTPLLLGLLAHAFAVRASGSRLGCCVSGSRLCCAGFRLTAWPQSTHLVVDDICGLLGSASAGRYVGRLVTRHVRWQDGNRVRRNMVRRSDKVSGDKSRPKKMVQSPP